MAKQANRFGKMGGLKELSEEDVRNILEMY